MKRELLIYCVLIAVVKPVPVHDSDTELLFDERYAGVPDHINGMPLERDGDFNEEMDAEMFLGDKKDDIEATNDEHVAKDTLEQVFELADKNSDDLLSLTELKEWMHNNAMKHRKETLEYNTDVFKYTDLDSNGYLEWEEYLGMMKQHIRNAIEEERRSGTESLRDGKPIGMEEEIAEVYNGTVERDEHLWKMADANRDGRLNEEEFLPFQHPEHSTNTIRVMVRDLIKLLDEDKDGQLSEEEFMGYYLHRRMDFDKSDTRALQRRRKEFKQNVDTNKDGFANQAELENYLDPQNVQHAFNEAMYLVEQADDDKDGMLSLPEILNHNSLFVGSRAANFISYNLGHVIHWEL